MSSRTRVSRFSLHKKVILVFVRLVVGSPSSAATTHMGRYCSIITIILVVVADPYIGVVIVDLTFEFIFTALYPPVHQVHMFRMSLWAEHLKTWEESFRFPGTLECTQVLLIHVKIVLLTHLFCTQRVKEMCNFNWQSYNFEVYGMDQMEAPPGHLLLYPVQVS